MDRDMQTCVTGSHTCTHNITDLQQEHLNCALTQLLDQVHPCSTLLNGTPIKQVHSYKILSVVVCDTLTRDDYSQFACTKVSKNYKYPPKTHLATPYESPTLLLQCLCSTPSYIHRLSLGHL